jgi:dienelactone hydrolase
MTQIHRLVLWLAVVCLASCASPSDTVTELPDLWRTWTRATVVLPPFGSGGTLVTTMDSPQMRTRLRLLPANAKVPVVVYAHGCTGMGGLPMLQALAEAGFIVVAPDSFARHFRPLQCDADNQAGGRNLFVYDFRLEEIAFALDQLWLQPWADWSRLMLLGASEGGVAAALYRGDEFAARVILQWTCGGAPHVAGLAPGKQEPVLAVLAADDPWYQRAGGGDCGRWLVNRPDSQSFVIPAAGGHELMTEPSAIRLVVEFLRGRAYRG